ncbi:MAG: transcriptional regulator [Gammaproteobacteria bacterium]|nr:transcriptional regulator [Gammaproteobacteria bacterium]
MVAPYAPVHTEIFSAMAEPPGRRMKPLPTPLRAVQAFGTVARAGSVVAAARELGVSPSAVSHLIRQLERRVAVALFSRAGRGLKLTGDGERLAGAVIPALAAISDALRGFSRRGTELRISTLSTFAVRWLIPRLSRFQSKYPDIEIFLSTSTRAVDLAQETFDCAIRFGRGDWSGVASDVLYREELVPACNPSWREANALRSLKDLRRTKLLHARARRQDWSRWLGAHGIAGVDTDAGPIFETRDLAIQAAIAQMGIAIVDPRFIEAEIAAGQLTIPFERRLPLDTGYWLVWQKGRETGRPLSAFRRWLAEEIPLRPGSAGFDAHGRS